MVIKFFGLGYFTQFYSKHLFILWLKDIFLEGKLLFYPSLQYSLHPMVLSMGTLISTGELCFSPLLLKIDNRFTMNILFSKYKSANYINTTLVTEIEIPIIQQFLPLTIINFLHFQYNLVMAHCASRGVGSRKKRGEGRNYCILKRGRISCREREEKRTSTPAQLLAVPIVIIHK